MLSSMPKSKQAVAINIQKEIFDALRKMLVDDKKKPQIGYRTKNTK